jgi:hypothetical protein
MAKVSEHILSTTKELDFEHMIIHPCQSGLDIKTSVHIITSNPKYLFRRIDMGKTSVHCLHGISKNRMPTTTSVPFFQKTRQFFFAFLYAIC